MADESELRFIPLGGLGEIGMNCFALEQDGEILVVDCGVAFSDDGLGSDILHPDFSWLLENQERLVGLVITHGHEDHIGGIPYLLRDLSVSLPIYAPAHARELILDRLAEDFPELPEISEIEAREAFSVGSFLLEGFSVAHSIVDALALRIETEAGTIVHTGDFNLDSQQPAGVVTDLSGLSELGDEGVRCLFSDSTNIDSPEALNSEGDVARELETLVESAAHRVIVGLFSSNLHRISALGVIAERTGRKLCFVGRSLERHVRVATKMGRLCLSSDLLVNSRQLSELSREQVLLVCGGCQGEGASALRRLSTNAFPDLKVEEGDSLLMSSRAIPGNEKRVFSMLNDFARRGVLITTIRNNLRVHVSGHASRDELARMLQALRPRSFVPVHGTLHHLSEHAKLAEKNEVKDVLVVENGSTVVIPQEGALRRGAPFQVGVVRISRGGLELPGPVRRRRGELARQGVFFISASFGHETGVRVECSSLGVVGLDNNAQEISKIRAGVVKVLSPGRARPQEAVVSEIRRVARAAILGVNGERPTVEVQLHQTI